MKIFDVDQIVLKTTSGFEMLEAVPIALMVKGKYWEFPF